MLTTFVLTMLVSAAQNEKTYAKPDLLVEPAALKKQEQGKGFVILDARRKAAYLLGHVPGAVWVDQPTWARAFTRGDDKADWASRIGALGIGADTKVIVYDDNQNRDAARIWWFLRYWGVEDVRLLNGGWGGWKSVDGDVSKDVPEVKAVKADLTAQSDRLATKDELMKALEKKTIGQLVDARTQQEHRGEKSLARRDGSIPGAKHLEWSDTIDRKTGRFVSADELAKRFAAAGVDPTKPATTYCLVGIRSSVMAFALELAGGKPVKNYLAGWAEWGNDDKTPIEKPKVKQKDK